MLEFTRGTFSHPKRILFIGYDRMSPVTHGGRIAHYGYYLPLTYGYTVDTIFLPNTPKSMDYGPIPKSLSGREALADLMLCYDGAADEEELYDILNSPLNPPYHAIVTVFPIDRSRIPYDTKVIKLTFDLQSEHLLEFPEEEMPKVYIDFAKGAEAAFSIRYDFTVTCSPLDQANMKTMHYIPFYMEPKQKSLYLNGSRTILLAGSGHWHRFTKAYQSLKILDQTIQGKIYVYGSNVEVDHDLKNFNYHFDPTGYRSDICSYLIQPVDYRSGIPSKVLEALSRGIPVLTTRETKQRFFSNYRHVYNYDSAEELNDYLMKDIRSDGQNVREIYEDLERERGLVRVFNQLKTIIESPSVERFSPITSR